MEFFQKKLGNLQNIFATKKFFLKIYQFFSFLPKFWPLLDFGQIRGIWNALKTVMGWHLCKIFVNVKILCKNFVQDKIIEKKDSFSQHFKNTLIRRICDFRNVEEKSLKNPFIRIEVIFNPSKLICWNKSKDFHFSMHIVLWKFLLIELPIFDPLKNASFFICNRFFEKFLQSHKHRWFFQKKILFSDFTSRFS